jgi:hypothetical protein
MCLQLAPATVGYVSVLGLLSESVWPVELGVGTSPRVPSSCVLHVAAGRQR